MFRKPVLTVLATVLIVSPCFGQDWARKMFKESDHDFGNVARGAKAEFRFVFENLYLEDIHIANVYASCGCTSVRIENPTVKTYEQGAIVAHFNTDTFRGQRGATITVVIDKPYPAEVQLQDRGFIRDDVAVEPGSVQIGSVDQGVGANQDVNVNYTGGDAWQITGVKSSNPHITAQAVQTSRGDGQVTYALKVHVDKNAPAGYMDDHLMLVTNDPNGADSGAGRGPYHAGHHGQPDRSVHGRGSAGPKSDETTCRQGKKAVPHPLDHLRRQVVPFRYVEGRRGQAVAFDPSDFFSGERRGQGGQDDQDQDRPGRHDARAGGLRSGGGGAVATHLSLIPCGAPVECAAADTRIGGRPLA